MGKIDYMEEKLAFEKKEYLTTDQVAALKERFNATEESIVGQMGVITLADSFVRQNGKADAEYESLFETLQKTWLMNSESFRYPETIKHTFPILFIIAFCDYMILVGGLSEADMEEMRREGARQMGLGHEVPKA